MQWSTHWRQLPNELPSDLILLRNARNTKCSSRLNKICHLLHSSHLNTSSSFHRTPAKASSDFKHIFKNAQSPSLKWLSLSPSPFTITKIAIFDDQIYTKSTQICKTSRQINCHLKSKPFKPTPFEDISKAQKEGKYFAKYFCHSKQLFGKPRHKQLHLATSTVTSETLKDRDPLLKSHPFDVW